MKVHTLVPFCKGTTWGTNIYIFREFSENLIIPILYTYIHNGAN